MVNVRARALSVMTALAVSTLDVSTRTATRQVVERGQWGKHGDREDGWTGGGGKAVSVLVERPVEARKVAGSTPAGPARGHRPGVRRGVRPPRSSA